MKCDGDGAAEIRQRRDWSVDDFDAVEIRRSSSTKFDGAAAAGDDSVPKIIINDTIIFFSNCNQHFGNFKP